MVSTDKKKRISKIDQVLPESIEGDSEVQKRLDLFVRQAVNKSQQSNQIPISKGYKSSLKRYKINNNDIELLFSKELIFNTSAQIVNEVKESLSFIQSTINQLPHHERLAVLETINLFNSRLSISKLLPPLLILKGDQQKMGISSFVFPVLNIIYRNVEILVADKRLFTSNNVHEERGRLFSLVNDMANSLRSIFSDSFIDQNKGNKFTAASLANGINLTDFSIHSPIESNQKYIYDEFIDDEDILRQAVLSFITTTQTHEALYSYALKRQLFNCFYLLSLTRKGKFKKVRPYDASRVLAGCMLTEQLIQADDEVANHMLDQKLYNKSSLKLAKTNLFKEYTPKQINRLIYRFKVSLKGIYKSDFEEELKKEQAPSIKRTIDYVWVSLIDFISSVVKTSIPNAILLTKIKEHLKKIYSKYIRKKKKASPAENPDKPDKQSSKSTRVNVQPPRKKPANQRLSLVKTDVIAFRGEKVGANYSDFSLNFSLFDSNKNVLNNFLKLFRVLFTHLEDQGKTEAITYEGQPRIKEYYVPFSFGEKIVCLGITHLNNTQGLFKIDHSDQMYIKEEALFPYVLLFTKGIKRKARRIWSRTTNTIGKVQNYNFVEPKEDDLLFLYTTLEKVISLLPKEENAELIRYCNGFIASQITRIQSTKPKNLIARISNERSA